MFFLFMMLSTFYGPRKAFAAICWVPLAFGLVFGIFIRYSMAFGNTPDQWWQDLAHKIVWVSLAQAGLGAGLLAREIYRKKPIVSLIIATFLSGSLFWLWLVW
jgi:hypothetical protein